MEKLIGLLYDPSVISAIIGALVALFLYWQNKKNSKRAAALEKAAENEEKTTQQIAEFQKNMLDAVEMHQKENINLKAEINEFKEKLEKLKSRFDSIKNSILTLNLFGSLSPIAMWGKDTYGKRIYHNQAYEIMTGVSLEDAVGKTDYEIMKNYLISDNWKTADLKVKVTKQPTITIEKCINVNRPNDVFKVLSFKWPVMHGSRVVGIEGAAITLDLISSSLGISIEQLEALI